MRSLNKLKENKLLFYDIETAPAVKELKLDTPLFDSWAYKVNKTGDKSNDEIIESYSKEAGLYPEFAKIVTIVVGKIIGGKIKLITLDDEKEVDILTKYNDLIERNLDNTLVGFVNIGFDAPYIFKRMIINGIEPSDKIDHSGLRPWEIDEVDLAMEWKGTSFARASLINIATVLGLPSPKSDISGADVGKVYWEEGLKGLKRIAKYCRADVATTINVYRKMRLLEALEVDYVEEVEIEEIPLLKHLFAGGRFGKAEKEELDQLITELPVEERKDAFTIIDAMVSGAKGKTTKITKTYMKTLKAKFK